MAKQTKFRNAQELRIAIDTGGTFTDCVWLEQGKLRMLKVFSTPADPSDAIGAALETIGGAGKLLLLHGTTVGTNTVLQRKGARVALITTAGFEDVIELGRQARPKLYDFFFDRVEPLVPSELRFGVEERTAADGSILQDPSSDHLSATARLIRERVPDALAICFLFSFANPANEKRAAAAFEALHLPMSVSHQILPEFREYERTSTVVLNAYLQPVMKRYLENLAIRAPLTGRGAKVFVMQSSGGITPLTTAANEPVRTVLSGPAGGVVGAAAVVRRSGFDRIISFDMGGTSTDVALVDRSIRTSSQAQIGGLPIGVPMLDIHTVGAGGGSLARFDAAGALRVGPESAGADPGPICYGKGTEPTVTDANLILGRLQPHKFLGGTFALDLNRTRAVVRQWLAKHKSRLSLEDFAAGVIRVASATMERAIRVVSIERGYDPREFSLVAFGGAGGLHAGELAAALEIPRVIVPAMPGALSALGILTSDVVRDYSRTVLWRVSKELPTSKLKGEFSELRRRASLDLEKEGWGQKAQFPCSVDVRYRGQGFELNLPLSGNLLGDFRKEHERRYGYSYSDRDLEIVTLRLRAIVKSKPPSPAVGRAHSIRRNPSAELVPIFYEGRKKTAALYERENLRVGRSYVGPAVIAEYSATTLVRPDQKFRIDRAGNLIIEIR